MSPTSFSSLALSLVPTPTKQIDGFLPKSSAVTTSSSSSSSKVHATPESPITTTSSVVHSSTTRAHGSRRRLLPSLGDEESGSPTGVPGSSFGRREAIGIWFCLVGPAAVGAVVPTPPSTAASAAPPPCKFTVAASGLFFCDKVVGTGPKALEGQLIKAHYVGKLESGKVFDSSYNRGKPLTFRVGVGEVIKGWDEGILGGDGIPPMLAGGKRSLKIPSELGYGVRGAGCRGGSCIVPPNSVLLFDVEFIGKA